MNKITISLILALFIAVPVRAQEVDIRHQCLDPFTDVEREIGTNFRKSLRTINGFSGNVYEGFTRVKRPDVQYTDFVYRRGDKLCWLWSPSSVFEDAVRKYIVKTAISDTREDTQQFGDGVKTVIPTAMQDVKDRTLTAVESVQTRVKEFRAAEVEAFRMKQEESQAQMEAKRMEYQKRVEAQRLEAKERMEARRAEFQEKLQRIKDERKRRLTERINEQLNKLNERLTGHFSNALDKLDNVLERIGSRADKAQEHGVEMSSVRTAIGAASAAIGEARDAVEAQSGMVYEIDIVSDESLRNDVGEARKKLHDDLAAVRDRVKGAREAVRSAATTLAQIPRVNEFEVAQTDDDDDDGDDGGEENDNDNSTSTNDQ